MGNSARKMSRSKAKQLASSIYGNKAELSKLPLGPCLLSAHWREEGGSMPPLVTAVMSRVLGGQLLAGVALVDRTCLGIKNAYRTKPFTAQGFSGFRKRYFEQESLEEAAPIEVLSVVYHAVDYAAKLGFEPHPDFSPELFGPRPEKLIVTPHARDPKPNYIAGPDDDVEPILEMLNASVGKGNYDFTYLRGFGAVDAFDE